jgi:hypothetical protein
MSNEPNEHDKKKNVWKIILEVLLDVALALAGATGVTACVG